MDAVDFRLGDWRTALADVECDVFICDPPYSAITHAGWNAGEEQVLTTTGQKTRQSIDYGHLDESTVSEFITSWSPRVRGWMCCFCDDELIGAYKRAYRDVGRYAFAAVSVIQPRPRLLGDGPASWTVYLMVARPRNREFMKWDSLPGSYASRFDTKTGITSGSKPIELMRAIVCDYSRPGDLICDPFAGGGTTLMAARAEGRRAVGSEVRPDIFELASQRLQGRLSVNPKQESLF